MTWTPDAATSHLEEIAKVRGITIVWTEKPPESHPGYAMVWINPPTSPIRYLTALHEFGHCIDPQAVNLWKFCGKRENAKDYRKWINAESAAWGWAFAECRPALAELVRERDWQMAGSCWLSYGRHLALQPVR
jgi:hypothetical protein